MLFLIALVIAVCFTVLFSKRLHKTPIPFYVVAVLITASAIIAYQLDIGSDFFYNWVLSLFSKGAMAAAFWAIVMWVGALPKGSKVGIKLLSVRGELSILAALITASHIVIRGILYLRQLLRPQFSPDADFLLTCIISLAMILIMLPLTVLSVKRVRRKMAAKRWKRIQRWAYGFYGLIYIHVLVLYLPSALRGRGAFIFTIVLYTIVWFAYLIVRLRKSSAAYCQ